MNKKIQKYKQNLTKLKNIELKKTIITNLHFQSNFSFFKKYYQKKLFKVNLFKKTTKLRSICLFTGRSRGFYRLTKMSRTQTRRLINNGFLSNLQYSS